MSTCACGCGSEHVRQGEPLMQSQEPTQEIDKMRVESNLALTAAVIAALMGAALRAQPASAQDRGRELLAFDVKLDVVKQELSPEFCWFHPRVAAVPGAGREGQPAVIMTLQKHLVASDHYSGFGKADRDWL